MALLTNVLRENRKAYRADDLDYDEVVRAGSPMALFQDWLKTALEEQGNTEANSFCLSTVDAATLLPDARMVLCKDATDEGITFYSNYSSIKIKQIESTADRVGPHLGEGKHGAEGPCLGQAAATFYWHSTHRQVRFRGLLFKLPENESVDYFASRPFDSQLAAAISKQSQVLAAAPSTAISEEVEITAAHLRKEYQKLKTELQTEKERLTAANEAAGSDPADKPTVKLSVSTWGGLLLQPLFVEFWHGHSDRLHERVLFQRDSLTAPWKIQTLYP